MMVTTTAQMKAQRAPRRRRVLLGILLFATLLAGIALVPALWLYSRAPERATAVLPSETAIDHRPSPREAGELEAMRRREIAERRQMEEGRRRAMEREEARRRAMEEAKRLEQERKAGERLVPRRATIEPPPPPAPQSTAPVSAGAGAPIPQFPWPPPAASATYVLPETVFERGRTTGQAVTAIIAALERRGYVERSFFTTPADGVVLVTRLERINEDGSSAADLQRWPAVGEAAQSSVGFAQFLRGLFYVDPGRYRVIVFILQDAPFSQNPKQPVTGQQARAWLRTGANVLPRELADRSYRGDCTVLVYEFASDGTAVRVVESRLTGLQHLERSGVLATLGRPN
jgi:hypothetical protein